MHSALDKLVSPVLYYGGTYSRRWQSEAAQSPFALVLTYHRVIPDNETRADGFAIENGVPASVFEAQLRFMLKHFIPARASDVAAPRVLGRSFVVTLDDGYADNFQVAAPILRRLGIPATFFVISDWVGSDRLFWWEQLALAFRETRLDHLDLSPLEAQAGNAAGLPGSLPLGDSRQRAAAYETLCAAIRSGPHEAVAGIVENLARALEVSLRHEGRDYALMNWDQVRELSEQGFEIGGHTASHASVVDADKRLLQREIVDSMTTIENKLQAPVVSFAYPYGCYRQDDARVTRLLSDTSCKAAFTTDKRPVRAGVNRFEIPRITLNRKYSFACAYNVQQALERH